MLLKGMLLLDAPLLIAVARNLDNGLLLDTPLVVAVVRNSLAALAKE